MDKCCSLECMAFTNWTLDSRRLFASALWTHARVRGDLLYHNTLSAKRERCKIYFCWLFSAATRLKKSHFQTFSNSSWRWRAGGSLRRHFEHTHAFGETSSITPHSPLSGRGIKSIFVGFPVQPPAQKSHIFGHFQTLVGAGEQTALCVATLETWTRAGKPPLSRHTLR